MKKNVLLNMNMILLILILFPAACISSPHYMPVKGTGEPVEKDYKVSDFHGIDVAGGFDVILIHGNSEDVKITAQESLFEHITVEVEMGILKIYTERGGVWSTGPMIARITFKTIDQLEVSGGGDIDCETSIDVPQLDVNLSGGGDLNGTINTDKLNSHISGGGDAEINGSIKSYNLSLSGGGSVKSDLVTGTIQCTVSGGGNATLAGQASVLEIEVSGGGDVNAGQFLTEATTFSASGGSDIRIHVTKELKGGISGGGDVYYSGNPEIVQVDARGGSEVHKQ